MKCSLNSKLFIYLFLSSPEGIFSLCFGETGRGRGREKHQCWRKALIGCLSYAPKSEIIHSGMGDRTHNVGYVPSLGIEPTILWLQNIEPHCSGSEAI